MPDPNPLNELDKALAMPRYHNRPVDDIRKQCRFFWRILQAAHGQHTHTQVVEATKVALAALGAASWNQTEHELFWSILLDGRYVRHNRHMQLAVDAT